MAMQPDRQIADMEGTGALPRKNGELVFDAANDGMHRVAVPNPVNAPLGKCCDPRRFRQEIFQKLSKRGLGHRLIFIQERKFKSRFVEQ